MSPPKDVGVNKLHLSIAGADVVCVKVILSIGSKLELVAFVRSQRGDTCVMVPSRDPAALKTDIVTLYLLV
jgi:hypothetical protein